MVFGASKTEIKMGTDRWLLSYCAAASLMRSISDSFNVRILSVSMYGEVLLATGFTAEQPMITKRRYSANLYMRLSEWRR